MNSLTCFHLLGYPTAPHEHSGYLNQYQGGMCIRDLEDDRKDSTVPHIASRPQLDPTDSAV